MKIVTLEIEDSKFEQFMVMLDLLKSDVVKRFQVQKTDDEFKIDEKHCLEVLDRVNRGDLTNDPLAQELQRRIQEIDDGTMKLTPYSEGMDSMMQRIRLKYASA